MSCLGAHADSIVLQYWLRRNSRLLNLHTMLQSELASGSGSSATGISLSVRASESAQAKHARDKLLEQKRLRGEISCAECRRCVLRETIQYVLITLVSDGSMSGSNNKAQTEVRQEGE